MLAASPNSRKENTVSHRNFPKGEVVRFQDRITGVLRWIHWPSLISGAAIGFVALYLQTTNSLVSEVKHLQQRIAAVDSRMHQLAGTARGANEAGSLLQTLIAQGERVATARTALDSMADLQRTVTISAQEVDEARAVADRWNDLADQLIAIQAQQARSFEAIAEIDATQQDVLALGKTAASAHSHVKAMRTVLTDVSDLQPQLAATEAAAGRIRSAIQELDSLHGQLLAVAESTPAARQSVDGLVDLQQTLSSVEDSAPASANAEKLIALQQSLSPDSGLNVESASRNAEALLAMHGAISGQTGQIAASIENLELLADFQSELTEQLDQVESLRRQLTELMLLETTLARTMTALEPLTALGNLRRLDDAEMRDIARTMLDRRRERVAAAESKYDAESSPMQTASEEDRLVPEPPAE